ncbi:Flp pilus assembly protein CpaB [Variovorax terrae]|uniref:Flp pilus assembly protein CpaB n=1 Tax=Variovorax terrae TaxID=2923278 RepID=A0A9X1VVG5_9BURK|nr:Flp pilus assembly protein CpaB [Variovorax terrae]MCJ0763914.1 Flp pilus assembly protein CpaB [Variovorax terrae]
MLNFTKIIAVLLVVIGVLLGAYAWVLSRAPAAPPPAVVSGSSASVHAVVIAVKSLPAGQPIRVEDVRVEQLPIQSSDTFRDAGAVVGKVPVIDVGAGTPISAQQLATGLAEKVDEGERAVAIKVDEVVGVGNKIRPGDYVDVFFLLKRDNGEIDRSQSRLLLARKRVLAYGVASVDSMSAASSQGGNATAVPRTAVLAVPVDEINQLALGDANGRLLLALRNPKDAAVPDPSLFTPLPVAMVQASRLGKSDLSKEDRALAGTALADLVTRGGRPAAVPPKGSAPQRVAKAAGQGAVATTVEVIRGSKQEVLTY